MIVTGQQTTFYLPPYINTPTKCQQYNKILVLYDFPNTKINHEYPFIFVYLMFRNKISAFRFECSFYFMELRSLQFFKSSY